MNLNHSLRVEVDGKLEITIHIRADAIVDAIRELLASNTRLSEKADEVMATLADAMADVESETTVESGMIVLLTAVSDQLKAAQAANNPAAIQALIDHIDANKAAMAAAITANTPVTPSQIPDVPAGPGPTPQENQPNPTPAVPLVDPNAPAQQQAHTPSDATDTTANGQPRADGSIRNNFFLPDFDPSKPETN